MNRVVCVNPPGLPGSTANREGAGGMGNVVPTPGAFLYPPHALAVVAGALRAGGLDVTARDCVVEADSLPQAVAWASSQRPDWLVVQVSWATRNADAVFLREARAAIPGAPVVAIGASVPWMEEDLAQIPGIAWLHGEPERLLGEFLTTLGTEPSRWQGPLSPSMLHGAGLLDEASLEGLAHPAWGLLPWRKYGMLTVFGSKGCDHACAYCPYVVAQGCRFRARPVGEIVEEMAYIAKAFKPQRVVFRDPVFTHDRERVLALCREIARRGLRLAWECESRADDLDAEMVATMAKAGCTTVKMGLESADDDVLVAVGRVPDTASAEVYRQRALDAARACRERGIACRVFAMTGLADETDGAVAETAEFITQLQPAALTVKAADWYPGTRMGRADSAGSARHAQWLRESFTPAPAAPKAGLFARIKRRVMR